MFLASVISYLMVVLLDYSTVFLEYATVQIVKPGVLTVKHAIQCLCVAQQATVVAIVYH